MLKLLWYIFPEKKQLKYLVLMNLRFLRNPFTQYKYRNISNIFTPSTLLRHRCPKFVIHSYLANNKNYDVIEPQYGDARLLNSLSTCENSTTVK